jgi:ribosomal RNA-processing protein 1
MWMSDKPLVQEELSEELGSLVHCFPDIKISIQFFQQFLETMCLEWFGIDQWRIDKFMMVSQRVITIRNDDMTLRTTKKASILKN